LMVDIHQEKRASNRMIDEAMSVAHKLSREAVEMINNATVKINEAKQRLIGARAHAASAKICEERIFQSNRITTLEQQLKDTLNKHEQEHEAATKLLVDRSNKKHHQLQMNMISISQKLWDEHSKWQQCLADLDSTSKSQLSNKCACRRNAVQQQLDKSSAMEDQLREMIEAIEGMNYKLAGKVKSTKKDMGVARKLYEDTKEIAMRNRVKLRIEKEEKAHLKDELTRVLKAHQSQEELLVKYKAMVDQFMTRKRSLKLEVKIGCRGGASWQLWVTEVCCELLVNGSPPSAIPSSIGTLFDMLYGEEPTSIPSLNYVRQCRVLVQIISKTITTMKLSVCTNWVEIFFDATVHRQVLFSAVVISLMGDTPESIDPVIVLSCVVLEDETLETQVDGIVSKVRSCSPVYRLTIQPLSFQD